MNFQSQEAKNCGICQESKSKYLCPKCGIPYCSLTCYRDTVKHLKCSESFYRDCVQEEIKLNERQNPEEARKMKEIIARVNRNAEAEEEDLYMTEQQQQQQSSSSLSSSLSSNKNKGSEPRLVEEVNDQRDDDEELDSDDDPPLEERIAGIDLEDSDTLWNALTPEEQEDFQKKIDDGSLLKIVYENEPPPDD